MTINCQQCILLTGAGFTKNFGAPLAGEMWELIFNHREVQRHQCLRELMLTDFDYESIYYQVLDEPYSEQEKDSLLSAVSEAYAALDTIVRQWKFRSDAPFPVNIYRLRRFILRFEGIEGSPGYFFTTNQDLFVERQCEGDRLHLRYPGLARPYTRSSDGTIPREEHLALPSEDKLQRRKSEDLRVSRFFYMKLHGSQDWISSAGDRNLVIGKRKMQQIGREPLLAWYSELFKEVLLAGNRRLMVIGYGFGDDHINKAIATAIREAGLRLHIICPSRPEKFLPELNGKPFGTEIRAGLAGYYPHSLVDIFPGDQSETQALRSITENFFGIRE